MVNDRPTYRVLHRDESLVVIDKASGVLTVSAGKAGQRCVLDDLRRDGLAVAPVHRLDRETSGVLLLCLDKAQRPALEELFRKHEIEKDYLALVHGTPRPDRGTIDVPILDLGDSAAIDRRGRRAVSHFEVLEPLQRAALVRVRIDTGRHHQIRLHLAHAGHPVVGDRKLGRRGASDPGAKRTLLHAARLAFRHPVTGRRLVIQAPLPEDMETWRLSAGGSREAPPMPSGSPVAPARKRLPGKRRRGR